MRAPLQLIPLADFPLVEPGNQLNQQILDNLQHNQLQLEAGDVLVLAQKIVSKAENCYVYLDDVEPSAEAMELAAETDKDPRQVELILRESKEVVRSRPGVIIVEHCLGLVHANAGIDKSNIETDVDKPRVLLLPENPDGSALALREFIAEKIGIEVAVIINDSVGRAWRNGTVGIAIGTAGFEPLDSQIGDPDLFGRELEITEVAVADELAAAASFMMGQGAEGVPVVLIRGAQLKPSSNTSSVLIREKSKDLFR